MIKPSDFRRVCLVVGALILSACSSTHKLPSSPNLYASIGHYPEEIVPLSQRTTNVDLLYITDRKPVEEIGVITGYSDERSASMSTGIARLRYGDKLSWNELIAFSQTTDSKLIFPFTLTRSPKLRDFRKRRRLFL